MTESVRSTVTLQFLEAVSHDHPREAGEHWMAYVERLSALAGLTEPVMVPNLERGSLKTDRSKGAFEPVFFGQRTAAWRAPAEQPRLPYKEPEDPADAPDAEKEAP